MKPTLAFTQIYIILVASAVLSCSRAVEDKAELVITLPGKSMSGLSSKINQSNFVNNLVSTSSTGSNAALTTDWSSIRISTLSQMNCFFVIAGGPDMEKYMCAKFDAEYELRSSAHYFSEIAGPASLGDELKMQVLAGKDRVFKLFGMNSSSEEDCKSVINNTNFSKSNLSKPYLIGQSEPTEIFVDKPNTVKISPTTTLDLLSYVDYCTYGALNGQKPVFNETGAVEFKIKAGGFGQNYYPGQCVPITASILDSNGQNRISDVRDRFELLAGPSVVKAEFPLFSSLYNCENNISPNTAEDFDTYGLPESKTQWARLLNMQPYSYYFDLTNASPSSTITVNGSDVISTILPKLSDLPISASDSTVVMSLFPERVQNSVCSPIRLTRSKLDFSDFLSAGERLETNNQFTISYNTKPISGTQGVYFFNDSECSNVNLIAGGPGAVGTYTVSGTNAVNAYVKVVGLDDNDKIDFEVTHFDTLVSSTTTSSAHYSMTVDGNNLSTFEKFVIQGPGLQESATSNAFLQPLGKCLGPFRIYPVNQHGAYVNIRTTYAFNFSVLTIDGAETSDQIFATSSAVNQRNGYLNPCSSLSPSTSGQTFYIGGTTYPSSFEFYYKTNSYNNLRGEPAPKRVISIFSPVSYFKPAYMELNIIDPTASDTLYKDAIGGSNQGGSEASAGKISSGK